MRCVWMCGVGLLGLLGCKQDNEAEKVAAYVQPELTVVSPPQAAWVQDGEVPVEGSSTGLAGLTINGVDAQVDGRSFTGGATVERGIDVIEVRGEDSRGDAVYERVTVLAGDYGDPVMTLERAFQMRVNEPGLEYAGEQVETMVDPAMIADQAEGMKVYEDAYGLLGWDAVTVEAVVSSLSMGNPDAELDPTGDGLELEVEVPDFELTLDAVGEALGIGFDIEVSAWADRVTVEGLLQVDAVDGELTVDLLDPVVTLDGFGYDTSLIPFGVEEYLFVESIESFLEEMAVVKIAEMVPPLLEEQLASLDLSFETEIMGHELGVAAHFADAGMDRKGMYVDVNVELGLGDEDTRQGLGFLQAPETEPVLDTQSDVAMVVADDLINRIIYGLWRSGVMDMTLSTEDESLDLLVAAMLKSEVAVVTLEPMLPAVVLERGEALELQIGALDVTIHTPGGEFGDYLKLTAGAQVPLSVVTRDGFFVLEIGDPVLDFMVQEADWGAASTEAITQMLEALLSPEVVLAMVGELAFPIPTLGDVVAIDTVEVDLGDADFHTGVRVNFN